jgi:hypothetical protein
MKKIEASDPFEPRLKPISKDKSAEGLSEAWNLQIRGDSQKYLTLDGKKEKNMGKLRLKLLYFSGIIVISS